MIRQATSHSGSTSRSPMFGFTQLLVGHAEIVRTANQVHARMQRLQARSGVPTFAGQACQSLPEGRIQAFDERRIKHASPCESWSNRAACSGSP
jgi:hypothetical protein